MFIKTKEMKTVLYNYQMNEIAESDTGIIAEGIEAAIQEVKAYFQAANNRRNNGDANKQQFQNWVLYDIDAIFSAEGSARNAFVLRLCKTIAAWNICELSNVDIIYDHVKERYENAVRTLERIAGYGEAANNPLVVSGLPVLGSGDGENGGGNGSEREPLPFRFGSREKFNHDL